MSQHPRSILPSILGRAILLALIVAVVAGTEQYLLMRHTPAHLAELATRRVARERPAAAEAALEEIAEHETFRLLVALTSTGVIVASAIVLFVPVACRFANAADQAAREPRRANAFLRRRRSAA